MEYIDFASNISFFEFTQDEFKKPHFKIDEYKNEISLLEKEINIEKLTDYLKSYPKIFDIFEEIIQLKRFTNAQYINFCFDVNALNDYSQSLIIKYINNRVLNYENGNPNNYFLNIIKKINTKDEKSFIFEIKKAISDYSLKCSTDKVLFHNHIVNSIDARLRISKYLIENLDLNNLIKSVNVSSFLENKRHPKDTKAIHGNFATMRIEKILTESDFDKGLNDKFSFLKEIKIDGIIKKKDGKSKVLDFVLFYKGRPKFLIETNFYTTSGTKIGINQGEYIDLLEIIDAYNKEFKRNLKFIWITDGNYWLTSDGGKRFINLKNNYFKKYYNLLNLNLFRENIFLIKEEMTNED
jgi:hypothetical protein